ncbi:hypothetical protein CEXT_788951 [Caerostris extrusa]|uniref:Uncharacterized protein n=1 Tax=Caerostris extrusa TaxID=172846 RepID=A0AAV4MVM7_CAEEX|nr:hypothetical protein CEXT_788951 [Caerostris extrusa]
MELGTFERTFIENFTTNETRVPLSISSLTERHYFRKIPKRNRISLFTLRIAFGYTADIFLKNSFTIVRLTISKNSKTLSIVWIHSITGRRIRKKSIYFEVTLSFKHPKSISVILLRT